MLLLERGQLSMLSCADQSAYWLLQWRTLSHNLEASPRYPLCFTSQVDEISHQRLCPYLSPSGIKTEILLLPTCMQLPSNMRILQVLTTLLNFVPESSIFSFLVTWEQKPDSLDFPIRVFGLVYRFVKGTSCHMSTPLAIGAGEATRSSLTGGSALLNYTVFIAQ